MQEPSVVVAHLRELCGDLTGELDAVLDRRVGLQRLTLDLLEEVWSSAKELVVRELPGLHVRRGALGAGRLFGIKSQYVNEDKVRRLALTRLILWNPYMFSCRTKLEN